MKKNPQPKKTMPMMPMPKVTGAKAVAMKRRSIANRKVKC